MPLALVHRAIGQAQTRAPLVQVMVLIHASRVLAATDKAAAREAFAAGLALAEGLAPDFPYRGTVLEQAVHLGVTADPAAAVALFRRLPPNRHTPLRAAVSRSLVNALADSGEFDLALDLLEDPACEGGGAIAVCFRASDPAIRLRALRAAHARWQARPELDNEFPFVFSQHWRLLPPGEAEARLDEILRGGETGSGSHPRQADFGENVRLHSRQDRDLFLVLGPLRSFKPPEQVDEILRAHPEVAAAARRYPQGPESLAAEPRPAPQPGPGRRSGGWIGSGRSVGGDPAGDPRELYRQDTDPQAPNRAPAVFWPSCHAYQTELHRAGQRQAPDPDALLAAIPDPDIALLAAIAYAAGAQGLPPPAGARITSRQPPA